MIEVNNKHQCVAAMELTYILFGGHNVDRLRMALKDSGSNLYNFVNALSTDPCKSLDSIINDSFKLVQSGQSKILDFFVEALCRTSYIGRRLDDYENQSNEFSIWFQSFAVDLSGHGYRSVPLTHFYEVLDTMKMRLLEESNAEV